MSPQASRLLVRPLVLLALAPTALAQTTWLGASGPNWNNPSNWDTGIVPDAGTDVIIASGGTAPSNFILDPVCRDLTIQSGASLSVGSGFDLQVTGDLTIDGTLALTASSSDAEVVGNWTNNGTFTEVGSEIDLSGTGSIGGSVTTTFPTLSITGGTRTLLVATTVQGDCSISSSTTLDLGVNDLSVGGNWNSAAAGVSVTGTGRVEFTGNGLVTTGTNSIPGLLVSSGTRQVNTSTVTGDLELSGGTLQILDGVFFQIQGNAALNGGSLEWPSLFAGTDTIEVDGNVVFAGTTATPTSDSLIRCGGDWTGAAGFSPTLGSVELDGGGPGTVAGTLQFANLRIVSGTKTFAAAASVLGTMEIVSGAVLDSDAPLSVEGDVTLGNATASWDVGTSTHTLNAGFLSTGASVTGAGFLEFDGTGETVTPAAIANLRSSAGTRTLRMSGVGFDAITGDLDHTGGTLEIGDNARVSVGGNATIGGTTLSFEDSGSGLDVLSVNGDLTITAASGTTNANSTIICSGDYAANAAFSFAGTLSLNSVDPQSIGGTGLILTNLQLSGGTKTLVSPLSISGNLVLQDGLAFVTNAAIDVNGSVSLGDVTSSWDLGNSTHTVSGDWTSSGGSATGAGRIEFDGPGTLSLGTGTISSVRVSAGDRSVLTGTLTGDLEMTGGQLTLQADETLTVDGSTTLSAGVLAWDSTGGGEEVYDFGGDVLLTAAAGSTGDDSVLRCRSNLGTNASFTPTAGRLEMAGTGTQFLIGVAPSTDPVFNDLTIASGTTNVLSAVTLAGDLDVQSGATLDTDAALDIGGNASLGDATATWDLGASTHRLVGSFFSTGGAATGAGVVELDGTALLFTDAGSISNATVVSGVRTARDSTVTGDLGMTGGSIVVGQDQLVRVDGDANLTGGTLGWVSDASGGEDVLEVGGNVVLGAGSGDTTANSVLRCGGDLDVGATFTPASGRVEMFGSAVHSLTGTSPVLVDLTFRNGSHQISTTLQVLGAFDVVDGASVAATGALDLDGDVTLDALTSFDLGAFDHTVAGSWVSASEGVTGTGFVVFDGPGALDTGTGSIPAVRVVSDLRQVLPSTVTGDLEMTGGTLRILENTVLTVGGNVDFSAGTYNMSGTDDGQLEVLDVAGDVSMFAVVGIDTPNSVVRCAGNWTSDTTYAPVFGAVELDGGGTTTVSSPGTISLANLRVVDGARTLAADLSASGEVRIDAAGSLALTGTLDTETMVVDGGSLDVGTTEVGVVGDWTSDAVGSTVTGAGVVVFTDTGVVSTGTNTLPNVRIDSGIRSVSDSAIAGDLDLAGGTLRISDDQTLTVAGNATLSGGSFTFANTEAGLETIDVEGDVEITTAVGSTSENTRVFCAGNWTSDATFAPANGLVVLDGLAATTIGGTGLTLPDVRMEGGAKSILEAATCGALEIVDGCLVDLQGPLDVNGSMTLGDATAGLELGGQTCTVAGDWTSTGANALGGQVEFDGTGVVDHPGQFDSVLVSAGDRDLFDLVITGDLDMTGGSIEIQTDQTVNVFGDCNLTGGTLGWDADDAGDDEALDVGGNVVCTAAAGLTGGGAEFRCAGDWTSNSNFAPTGGAVFLDGAATTLFAGAAPDFDPSFNELWIRNGVRQVTSDIEINATGFFLQNSSGLEIVDSICDIPASTMICVGTVDVRPGSALLMGPSTILNIGPGGTLRVIGDETSEAVVGGSASAGGGYTLDIDGQIVASRFRFQDMGPSGIIIPSTAVIGAFPNDLRFGTFTRPSAVPGSAMLNITRNVATEFRYVDFEDPGGVGTFNVTTLLSQPITFVNSEGNFAGEAFDQDPLDSVNWASDETVVDSFTAVPGVDVVDLSFTTSLEVDVSAFVINRTPADGGSTVEVATFPAVGPSTYAVSDTTVEAEVTYDYDLAAELTHGEVVVLATTQATPWGTDPPNNFLRVGAGGEYADIAAALADVATLGESFPTVVVEPGVYPSFTVTPNGAVGTLRILGDGTGPVAIDTTLGPIVIEGFGPTDSLEISGLTIGGGTSTNGGVVVQNCTGVILLDDLAVTGAAGTSGILVDASSQVAIQRTDMVGEPGLRVQFGSTTIASRGSLDELEVLSTSSVRLCQLPTSSTVDPDALLIEYGGIMPDIEAPQFVALEEPFDLDLTGPPFGIYFMILPKGLGWLDLPALNIQMVGLIDFVGFVILANGNLDPGGIGTLPLVIPGNGKFFGTPVVFQMVTVNPATLTFRYSNAASTLSDS